MLNCFVLDRDADCNEDDEGDGEDGEEDGKDDVGLLLNLLCSRHLANRGVAQHQDELETVEKKNDFTRFEFPDGRYIPDEEGGEEASTDPDVEESGVTKLGDVATDPVVQQKHIEDAEDGG